MAEGGLFVIRTFSRDLDARIAEAVLEANGIESMVIADNAAGMMPYLDALHPIRLAVKEADVDDAIALLDSDWTPDEA
jgi:Putative prokaryotic signal transducing protein